MAAYIGPVTTTDAANAADPTTVSTSGSGVTVQTSYTSNPLATSAGLSISLGFGGSVVVSSATSSPTVLAYLGDKAQVSAGSGAISFIAAVTAVAISDAKGFGVSLGFDAGLTSAHARVTPTVKAFTEGGGSLSGGSVSLIARSNVDQNGNLLSPSYTFGTINDSNGSISDTLNTVAPAFARVTLGSVGLAAGVAGGFADAVNSAIVAAGVGSGTQVSASTLLTILGRSFGDAQVDALSLALGLLAGIGIVAGSVTSGGTVDAYFDGTSGTILTANVTARADAHPRIEGRSASGSVGAAVNIALFEATASVAVTARVGGSLHTTSNVIVLADSRIRVTALYKALSISLFVSGVAGSVTAKDLTTTAASISGTGAVRSDSGNASVLAWHNFDGSGYINANEVNASAGSVTLALGLAISSVSMLAQAHATTTATVASGATLSAPSGTAALRARSLNVAIATYKRTQGGFLASIAPNANPTADASGITRADLLGHVRTGTAGSGASVLDVLAKADDHSFAGMQNAGGGIVSINDSNSSATGSPTVGVTLGGASSVIIATGAVNAKADSQNDADASTTSGTGGALNINDFGATATMTPTVTVDRHRWRERSRARPASSRSTRRATPFRRRARTARSTPARYRATRSRSRSSTTRTRASWSSTTRRATAHRSLPGINGRSFNVIVTGATTLQLGLEFTLRRPLHAVDRRGRRRSIPTPTSSTSASSRTTSRPATSSSTSRSAARSAASRPASTRSTRSTTSA